MERVGSVTPPPSGRPAQLNIAPRQVECLLDELRAYHAEFADLFPRAEQRHWALMYMQGQFLELERKSIEPMARALQGGSVQGLQQFIGVGAWSDEPLLRQHRGRVGHTLGQADGVVILDGSDFPKQGDDSVGVQRQYCGALGKRANCQASVLLGYASEAGYTLLDRRLYMPEVWFTPDYAERRQACGVPADLVFQTKNKLAGAMLDTLFQENTLPFRWVTMDEAFGRDTVLLAQIQANHKLYFAEIPRSTEFWQKRPAVVPPAPYGGQGRPATQTRLAETAPAPQAVMTLAQALPTSAWHTVVIHEGTKGPLAVDIASVRVVGVAAGLPDRDEWVTIRRASAQQSVDAWKFYRSNAPRATSWKTLARLTAWRWPIETTIEECKGELGMDHYEVRSWRGWHHHLTMTILAHHFLVSLRVKMGTQAPALTVTQVRKLLQVVLPKRLFDAQAALEEIRQIQQQNYKAYRSHRKRRLQARKKPTPN